MEIWKWMWEDGGYELYEIQEAGWVEKGVLQDIGALVRPGSHDPGSSDPDALYDW
jgi:hypothetical protein